MTITVRATYSGATDTRGSRIIVRWQGKQRTLSFNHAARDAFTDAIARALRVDEKHVVRTVGKGNADSRAYTIACAHPGDNHSADMQIIGYGALTLLPLCGFHASQLNSRMFESLRAAGAID